ncbi:MAG: AMP-binding protein [Minwuia thermotolerans]|nr:MAG: AMP-binding protein [Minwuia thermotolerans]
MTAAVPALAERRNAIATMYPQWQEQTLDRAFWQATERFGDRPFVISDELTLTYRQVVEQAEDFARGLRARGIGPGDRVALVMGNYPVYVPIAYAVWRLGATLIPVNFAFKTDELGYVIEQSQCRAVITMDTFRGLDYLAMLDELSPGWEQGVTDRYPNLSLVVVHGQSRPGVPTVEQVMADGHGDAAPLAPSPAAPTDPAVIMYTSGTTGLPKGVLQSHDNLLRNSFAAALHRGFEDGRRIISALPLYHAFGLVMGLFAASWVGGAVIPQLQFDPLATLKSIERHRVSDALFVPTMAMAVIEHPAVRDHDLSSLFACLSAAAATPRWVWQSMKEGLDLPELITGYGMTELSAATTLTDPDGDMDQLTDTVGRIVNGGCAGIPELGGIVAEYRTCDPYSGEMLPEGAEGELVCRSPMATSGYFKLPERTAELFIDGGWLRSGDLGRVLPNGFLQLTGRSKELYKSGGELVAPKEVEDILIAHDAVLQAFVIGLPDDRWGEVGAAWIVPDAGATASGEELIEWCQTRLARFKWPRHIFFTTADDLPKTPTGKVQKFELVKLAVAQLDGQGTA